jgi:small subunit ribosomal protein S17
MASMKKTKVGQVLSNKMNKTVIVQVQSYRNHPIYKKTIRNVINYKVHDESNESAPGDTVKIIETRPLSKEKRWRIEQIMVKAAAIEVKPTEIEPKLVTEKTEAKIEAPATADNTPAAVKQD